MIDWANLDWCAGLTFMSLVINVMCFCNWLDRRGK